MRYCRGLSTPTAASRNRDHHSQTRKAGDIRLGVILGTWPGLLAVQTEGLLKAAQQSSSIVLHLSTDGLTGRPRAQTNMGNKEQTVSWGMRTVRQTGQGACVPRGTHADALKEGLEAPMPLGGVGPLNIKRHGPHVVKEVEVHARREVGDVRRRRDVLKPRVDHDRGSDGVENVDQARRVHVRGVALRDANERPRVVDKTDDITLAKLRGVG